MRKPVIALVGRPNVGKSTLFNRLAGERLAVVDDIPGTTRDRLYTQFEWSGITFILIDTGGIDPTNVKIGEGRKPLSIGSADFIQDIRLQAEIAIGSADAVIFMVDVEAGVTPADREVADLLRKMQANQNDRLLPPVLVAVNKCESEKRRQQAVEFYELGMGEIYPISSLHGTGTGDMLDALVAALEISPTDFHEEEDSESIRIAIVGKPNVGKSSLLNRLIGEQRVIVSPISGTTRDSIDEYLVYENTQITLIDTAGIRRRGKVEPGVEKYSVIRSMSSIERADVALLVIDATTSITAQDTHIAGYILNFWKSAVVVVNKWDAIEKDTYTIEEYKEHIQHELNFLPYVPILFVSALTGQRVDKILPTALDVQQERLVKLSTSQLNAIMRRAQDKHPAPSKSGRHLKIYYATQVRNDPPTFMIFVNDSDLVHFTYKRYLENCIRNEYRFLGTPIRLVFKNR